MLPGKSTAAALATLALGLAAAGAAHAQYKCTDAGGKVSFQELPCASNEATSRLPVPSGEAGAPARQPNWGAIARGEVKVGMTLKELKQAMGEPDKTSSSEYESGTEDELTYYRGNRTLFVSVRNGVVNSVRNTELRDTKPEPTRSRCPTPQQIRDLEFEASRLDNRGNERLRRELAQARGCR